MHETIFEVLIWTILGSLATFLAFIFFIHYILRLFNKKSIEFNTQLKLKNLEKEKELLKTRIDVQEETIQKISKELHDNIIQILTLSKLNLSNLTADSPISTKIEITRDLIGKAVNEIANISRSLSSEAIFDLGLLRSLELEKERLFIISNIQVDVNAIFDQSLSNAEEQLILYRIIQESIRNSIIHGKATSIRIDLSNPAGQLELVIADNGIGFNPDSVFSTRSNKHQGLKNIIKRATIINASCSIESEPGSGVTIKIKRPVKVTDYSTSQ